MLEEAFDQVKDQMGPCGISCAICDLGNGTVAETAQKLQKSLKMYGVDEWAPMVPGGADINFEQFFDNLAWVGKYTACFGCEKGGGPPDCPIRICANERDHEICSKCSDLKDCEKFDWLGEYSKTLKEKLSESRDKTKKDLIEEVLTEINK